MSEYLQNELLSFHVSNTELKSVSTQNKQPRRGTAKVVHMRIFTKNNFQNDLLISPSKLVMLSEP